MDSLASVSCAIYRRWVRDDSQFVAFFRQATPEQELANLPLGSRPARRQTGGGIESLRAIPWIFAWMHNRLMLPAWLGAGEALQMALDEGQHDLLREMLQAWPFFQARLSCWRWCLPSQTTLFPHTTMRYWYMLNWHRLANVYGVNCSARLLPYSASWIHPDSWTTILGRSSQSGSGIFTPRRSTCCRQSCSGARAATPTPSLNRR